MLGVFGKSTQSNGAYGLRGMHGNVNVFLLAPEFRKMNL